MDDSATRLRPSPHPARLLAALALVAALASCGADTDGGTNAAAPADPATGMFPSPADLPDCQRIQAAAGAFLTGWALVDDSGPWGSVADRKHGISCTWLSPRSQSDNAFDMVQGASFGVMVIADLDMQSKSDLQSIGWAVEDPAVDALGGYIAFPGGALDFDKQLRPVGPQVIVGKVSVGLAQAGVMLVNDIEEGRPMTNRRAVDIAIAVQELVRH